jgi:hypothetical protein
LEYSMEQLMWQQKFVWVGLSTGMALAAIAVFAVWYVYFAITAVTGGVYPLGWLLTLFTHPALTPPDLREVALAFSGPRALGPDLSGVAVIVYPACWFYRIQRGRNYSIPTTCALVVATYISSCCVVGIVVCLVVTGLSVTSFIPEAVRRVWGALASAELTLNWQAIASLFFLIFALPILGGAMFTFIGGAMMLIPFIVVGPAVAFLHRWLLLVAFSTSGVSSLPPRPPDAASP